MEGERVAKRSRNRVQRFLRLIASTFDPRAWAHALKLVNYYNYTHVTPLRQVRLGQRVAISPTASFANGHNIEIGDRVTVGAHCMLWAGNGRAKIVLGDDVLLAPRVMMTVGNYRYDEGSPVTLQPLEERGIAVGRDAWLAYGVTVLPGVTIGEGAVVGACSVVTRDVAPYAVVAGNPARVVGERRRTASAPVDSPGRHG